MGKTVLTIDDSKILRMIIARSLAPFSVKTLEAENGEEGVVCAREHIPDVILLDYNMPVMDGYHTLAELKTDPDLKSIPVVMVTTETAKDTVIKLLKLGLNDYIAKPFTRELLLRKLNPILGLYPGDEVPQENAIPRPPREAPAASVNPTVLVVDEDESTSELLSEYLDEKFRVTTAYSDRAAFAALEQNRFDYMFLNLSTIDINGFEIVNAFLQGNNEGAYKQEIVGMTAMRTAQADIDLAHRLGINVLLEKPFTRGDVAKIIERMESVKKDGRLKKMRYLTAKGNVVILECPPQKSSNYYLIAEMLTTDILREIDELPGEGINDLIITVGEGFLSSQAVTKRFMHLIRHIGFLSLSVRLVAESEQARDTLKQFQETMNIPTDLTLECALGSIK